MRASHADAQIRDGCAVDVVPRHRLPVAQLARVPVGQREVTPYRLQRERHALDCQVVALLYQEGDREGRVRDAQVLRLLEVVVRLVEQRRVDRAGATAR